MKIVPLAVLLVVVGVLEVNARPVLESDKSQRDASFYILGSLFNAAISNENSKSQAASDRNESEWNNTEMLNGVNKPEPAFREQRGGNILIYSGGDAANVAVSYDGSEAQAAENDQKSGYNNQNLGMGAIDGEEEEFGEEERKK